MDHLRQAPSLLRLSLGIAFMAVLAAGCSAQTGIFAAGSKNLYLHCEGKRNGPVVVLDAGLFRDSTDWREVQPKIAQFTQACSYDREGLGKSVVDKGAKPEAECIDEQVEDLKRLLSTAGIRPPYVMVGHSAGGVRIRRYTRDHSSDVAGLVFVDSAHEEQIWRFKLIDPSSVQGPPADPVKARCGGSLPEVGEHLVWHYDLPLIVLEHGVPLSFEGPLAGHTAEFNRALDSMERDLASRSSRGELRIARKSGHDIMLEEPLVVVQAVRDVWREAGGSGH